MSIHLRILIFIAFRLGLSAKRNHAVKRAEFVLRHHDVRQVHIDLIDMVGVLPSSARYFVARASRIINGRRDCGASAI
jgi:hypothetical protein